MSTPSLLGRVITDRYRAPVRRSGPILVALYAGLALTVLATVVPYIDRATSNTLADHIRAGYPTYSSARIDRAARTYLVYLTAVGVFGAAGWVGSLVAVTKDQRWARSGATLLFILGTSVAVTDLLIKDTSGDTGLPAMLGWVGILPCLPGLLAVTLLWRRPGPLRVPTRPGAQGTEKAAPTGTTTSQPIGADE